MMDLIADAFLSSVISLLPTTQYSVIFTTTPLPPGDVHILHGVAETIEQSEVELKIRRRQAAVIERASLGNETLVDGPLFSRYQFFSPGNYFQILLSRE